MLQQLLEQEVQQPLFVCLFVYLFVCNKSAIPGSTFEKVFKLLLSGNMNGKTSIPVQFQVQVQERLSAPRSKRWHAQFVCYPFGYFRGQGPCPGKALAQAWRDFRREVDPKERWYSGALTGAPMQRW